jgi:hypothetical protein
MSASLPSGSAAVLVFPGVPLLATAPPGVGSTFLAPVFGAVADGIRDGDDFAGAAHTFGHLFSGEDSFTDADSEGGAG